ncbi:ABC transporter substrate-binding protein [Sciscionella marina]|uniref:ABC transporter substrate-binding protein n=1 Tax=Sciscionella marina TaxID=508770 RepID=UPI00035FFF94|nr:ABC transporter substrate-binding protein [Sciscionella marina]
MNRGLLLVLVAALAAVSACGANPPEVEGFLHGSTGTTASVLRQQTDQRLHDRLPAKIKARGSLIAVNNGSFPPYTIAGSDGRALRGVSADLATSLGQLLGIRIENVTVDGLPSQLTGIKAGRYDLTLGPTGDFPKRQKQNDFVDWVKEYVVFAVRKGNPKHIGSIEDTCGLRIAVMSGGSAEDVLREQVKRCAGARKPAPDIQSYKDQPSAVLAVQADRADGFFSSQAPLTYFVNMAGKDLQLAGVGKPNGFDTLYQGAVVPKNGPLRDVLTAAINELVRNGTYGKILSAWKVSHNGLDKAGINLARKS